MSGLSPVTSASVMTAPRARSKTTRGRSQSFFSDFRNSLNSPKRESRSRTETLSGTTGFYPTPAATHKVPRSQARHAMGPGQDLQVPGEPPAMLVGARAGASERVDDALERALHRLTGDVPEVADLEETA